MQACDGCRRVLSISPLMQEMTVGDLMGFILPVPSGFGRLCAWVDGPCMDCIEVGK